MFKIADVMFLYTETSLHCGSGTSLGVIDLPIQRERYTDYPVLQASGIKGAVRDWFETKYKNNGNAEEGKVKKVDAVFGPDFSRGDSDAFAGAATFTDGRILLFPIRSLKGVFAYTTSRFALSRFKRDLEMANKKAEWGIPAYSEKALGMAGSNLPEGGEITLEEYVLPFQEDNQVKAFAEWLSSNALPNGNEYEFWREKIKKDIVVLPDNIFRDFVKLATEIQARIKIDNDTKTAAEGALFYEESLHSDSLVYSVVMAQDLTCEMGKRPNAMGTAHSVMEFLFELNGQRAQFGGDATIGRGIVNIRFLNTGGKK